MRWTIEVIGNSTLTWNSSWPGVSTQGEGLSCTATFTGLPDDNSDFGLKEVKMEVILDGLTVELTRTTNIEVFFNPTATNNPGGSDKNWFYYWKDALFPSFSFTYNSTLGGFGYIDYYGHDEGGGVLHITGVDPPQIGPSVFTDGGLMGSGVTTTNEPQWNGAMCQAGINCFNITVLHEKLHYDDVTDGNDLFSNDGDWLYNGMEIDTDLDSNFPESGETDPNDINTFMTWCPSPLRDDEYRAYRAEYYDWQSELGEPNDLDWSENGEQW